MKTINKERDEKILEDLKTTLNCSETGKKFGVSHERVRQIAEENNFFVKKMIKKKAEGILENFIRDDDFKKKLSTKDVYYVHKHLGLSYIEMKQTKVKTKVLQLFGEGLDRNQIAEKIGVCRETVAKILIDEGYQAIFRGKKKSDRDKEIYRLVVKEGKSRAEVATLFNMTETNVGYCIRSVQKSQK